MIFTCLDSYSNNNSSNKSRNDTNMRMFFSLKNGNFVADFLAIPNFSLNFALKKVSLIKRCLLSNGLLNQLLTLTFLCKWKRTNRMRNFNLVASSSRRLLKAPFLFLVRLFLQALPVSQMRPKVPQKWAVALTVISAAQVAALLALRAALTAVPVVALAALTANYSGTYYIVMP